MNNKINEFLSILVCLILLIGLVFYTGFFNKYGFNDLKNLINTASNDISNAKLNVGLDKNNIYNKDTRKETQVGNYRTNNIPPNVLKGINISHYWNDIFNPNKKVVFYVYDNSGSNYLYSKEFHNQISQYANNEKYNRYFDFVPYNLEIYKNYYVGITGQTKICNSLQECNQIREKSSTKADMQMFLDRCAKNVCIINMKRKEFIMLKGQKSNETVKALNALKNW